MPRQHRLDVGLGGAERRLESAGVGVVTVGWRVHTGWLVGGLAGGSWRAGIVELLDGIAPVETILVTRHAALRCSPSR
jgi:hypothetical protein